MIQTNQVITANVTEYHSYRERPEYRIVHNCTGYGGPDGANYEHDNTGGMMNYSKGGGVRGYGMAKGGRACKMVSMKGS